MTHPLASERPFRGALAPAPRQATSTAIPAALTLRSCSAGRQVCKACIPVYTIKPVSEEAEHKQEVQSFHGLNTHSLPGRSLVDSHSFFLRVRRSM